MPRRLCFQTAIGSLKKAVEVGQHQAGIRDNTSPGKRRLRSTEAEPRGLCCLRGKGARPDP